MEKPTTQIPRKDAILSARYIEGLIADGNHVFIYENRVLKVDAWIKFHPGGDKAIKHMVGRDATDEITALHSAGARERMLSYQIGRIEGLWTNFKPPMHGGKYRPYTEDDCSSDEELSSEETSSLDGSTPPSPVFDLDTKSTLRKRNTPTSVTPEATLPANTAWNTTTGPAFLDARTQQEIAFDTAKYPPVDIEHQAFVKERYRALQKRMTDDGLFQCRYFCYFIEASRYTLFASLSYMFLRWGWYASSAFFLGIFWHQLVFCAHDAGHMAISGNFQFDSILGIIIADWMGGLSLGWWKRSHNVHHIITNAPEHDPDIQHIPFFAVSHRFFNSLWSTYYDRFMTFDKPSQFMLKVQNWSYYPIMSLARFNLYRLSYEYLLKGQAPKKGPAWFHVWLELAGQCFFFYWFVYGLVYKTLPDLQTRVIFLLISHIMTSPLHVQITLSHFAMSTSDMGPQESFPQRMLRTTMDVDCPTWLDFFHGGLQFQAIHHMYPRMPRHNLRQAQKYVLEFCKETGIPYAIFTFYDGNKEIISHLGEVAKQLKLMEECRKSITTEGVFNP